MAPIAMATMAPSASGPRSDPVNASSEAVVALGAMVATVVAAAVTGDAEVVVPAICSAIVPVMFSCRAHENGTGRSPMITEKLSPDSSTPESKLPSAATT